MTSLDRPVVRTAYQQSIADYWDREKDPVNLRLGEIDGLYHHHYGLGAYDPAVLDTPPETRDRAIIAEMHRLETAQADVLLDHLGQIKPRDRLLDAGCGRGGTSVMAHRRFGCRVDGVSLSRQQVDFANAQAAHLGVDSHVAYHQRNMLDTGFESGAFAGIWNNESTMYVDLTELFAEHARQLAPGGRYVTITGCYNDVTGGRSRAVSQIDQHYICNIHARGDYFKALAVNGFVPINVVDLTAAAIPYWELRAKSSVATGIEDPFLTAYREGSFHYLLIAADRV
ncbi:geranyl diphosphate 2-C-methyltransferase [Amycolatopsis magusensis]|uniref:geranyl diphosphate 2-C-methyltransferase n=1 Tax=Amycolatopsis magusensis TaxID=882444 RepID=UPI0024A85CD6|nr:geranyl diphosphate 2-C-methyltransferase [Amycolatopsis magusensis]MDI5981922.1 methyltransferase domain-containing protein [Amycolatopsis magusensis]